MNIAVLTSSRADYGIYRPLLKGLSNINSVRLTIIAFGTHLSPFYGHTVDQIIEDGFEVNHRIESILASDSANAVATAISLTSLKFAEFWQHYQFDQVLCLGDRYEMFAAVTAGVPYGVKFAHIHGGERTLGAIDNVFRHSITLASSLHFTATEEYALRVAELTESKDNIHVVGALSLDNLNELKLLSINAFKERFKINLELPTVLCTFHPETVGADSNEAYATTMADTLLELSRRYQIVITLPNADTNGTQIRQAFLELPELSNHKVICVENFGTLGYFSCMKHCSFLLGNTSSGIIEAASFGKRVINIGDRQKGRACGSNVIHTPIIKKEILEAATWIENQGSFKGKNPYDQGGAVDKIIEILKKM
ncbi:UDP-N-acetylglucosamine 2-epimerase (hydrolyzing) [Carboxylicivirga sp. A043]|uniref:UDP-N-acetylglucosamine 2-epimerase n=1 Tax=Carboxylicivirga litoralis TaxID=2816963 RepID=UPI0021CB7EC2|nr:UDP-N-acetylglucosamine 2-epimerase [Carboxylicivirga sp. A043]MCU4158143.1 UDP-N-acetylglucosamine 2-epimerase (hydrolyzing) [Carboxylicivirga sp. A043]